MTSVEYEVICQHLVKINEELTKIDSRLLTVETCVKTVVEKNNITKDVIEAIEELKKDIGSIRDEVRM